MTKFVIFIGIDISKQWFDAALYWSGLEDALPGKRFDNKQKGFEAFLEWVNQQLIKHQVQGHWYVCMEHTGIYGLALAHFLEAKKTKVVMESPLRIKRSRGLQRGKTDPIDAKDIAIYAYEKHARIKVRPLPSPLLLRVQTLLSLRNRLVRYQQGLDVAASELDGFIDQSISSAIAKYTSEITTKMNDQIKVINKQVKHLLCSDKKLRELYLLVKSVIGVGPVNTAYLLVYTNGFTAFEKSRQFSCYIGIAPFPHSSGSSVQRPDKVSFLANTRIKALISTAAIVAVNHDPQMRAFFKKKLAEGKDEGWIYNAIKNKIVNRVFAVVKRGTPYVKIDQHLS